MQYRSTTFFDPTPEIDALETDFEHGMSLAEWADKLSILAPDEFTCPTKQGNACTKAPGSEEKIKALRRRVRRKQCLWNPQDTTFESINEDEVEQDFETLGNNRLKSLGFKLAGKP